MRYVETPSTKPLRQSLARQLAELLLRIVPTGKYRKFLLSSEREVVSLLEDSNPLYYNFK